MTFAPRRNARQTAVLALVFLLAALLGLARPAPVSAGVSVCSGAPAFTALTEYELREAIYCFNNEAAGPQSITLQADILLGSSLPLINNSAAGAALTIDGQGYTVDGQGFSGMRPFSISANTIVTMENITITGGNNTSDGGGALYNAGTLTLSDSTVRDNYAQSGGGLDNDGTLTVIRSTVSGNSSRYGGGFMNAGALALFNSTLSGNSVLFNGGGIYNTNGTVALTNSTLSGNSAGDEGGGIFTNTGCFTAAAQVLLADGRALSIAEVQVGDEVLAYDFAAGRQVSAPVTAVLTRPATHFLRINGLEVTGEHPFATGPDEWTPARGLAVGDRILSDGGWTVIDSITAVRRDTEVHNITVAGVHNYYVSDGARTYLVHNKLIEAAAGQITLNNTIITNSTGGDCERTGGSFTGAFNLIDEHAAGAGECSAVSSAAVTGFDALLADNGGPTLTHAISGAGNAVDGGSNALAVDASSSPLTTDQRGAGFPRLQGASVDVGALEVTAAVCPGFPMSAGDEAELNNAIACFNVETGAGQMELALTADIDLTASTMTIDNAAAGLNIIGADHTVDGGGLAGVRPFTIRNTGVLISALTISGGDAGSDEGGGILVDNGLLGLFNVTVANNTAVAGGGVFALESTLGLINSSVAGNSALAVGGGIANVNTALFVQDSAVLNNEAGQAGGGILNLDLGGAPGAVISNSTFSGNSISGEAPPSQGRSAPARAGLEAISAALDGLQAAAVGQPTGGGLYSAGDISVINSTFAANAAGLGNSGGAIALDDGVMTLHNSILAGSTGLSDCAAAPGDVDARHTLIADTAVFNCGVVDGVDGNIAGVDPLLGPLADNGGPTLTHALVAGSPALDAGLDSLALDFNDSPPAFDQRGAGFPRFVGAVDMGAFEAQAAAADPCPAVAGNLIDNPCFEDGPGPWAFWTDAAGSYLSSSADPYQGQFAADVALQTAGGNVQLYQKNLPLKANTEYQLSFAARSSNGRDLRAVLHRHGAPFTNYGLDWRVDISSGWAVYETKFTTNSFGAPVNDARLRFFFGPFDANNMSYHIDWVVLREYDSGNPPPPIPVDPPVIVPPPGQCNPPVAGNLLLNPGYESGAAPWSFFTNGKGGFNTADADPYECDHNAKVSIQKQGGNVQLYQKGLTLQGGETYRLRLAARSSGGQDVRLYLHNHQSPYQNYGLNGIQLDLTSAWQVFVVEFTAAGSGALTNGRLRLWLAPFDQNGATFEFDDVLLTTLADATAAPTEATGPAEATERRRRPPQMTAGQPANVLLQQGYFLDGDEDGRLSGAYVPENGASWCYAARPSRAELFPADGKMARVRILGVGRPRNVRITGITQNELVGSLPDATGVGGSSARLRRERDAEGEGRVYHIAFTATYRGNTCSHEVVVSVPPARGVTAADSGAAYDSTRPSP